MLAIMRRLCVSVHPVAKETIQEPRNLGLLIVSPFHRTQLPAITWLILDGSEARNSWARHRHDNDFGLKMGTDVASQASMSTFRCHCSFGPWSWLILHKATMAASLFTSFFLSAKCGDPALLNLAQIRHSWAELL